VGEDQAPHLELTREIVRRFNNVYGGGVDGAGYLIEPQALIPKAGARVPGTDGRKMSKSYGNAIYISDTPDEIKAKVMSMLTDPARKRRTDPGDPDICPVFDLHRAFSPVGTREWAAAGCRSAGIGCLDCKARLAEHMLERLADVHARRPEFAKRPDTVWDVLVEGSRKAREVAEATMEDVRGAMKIRYSRP
jgi:tryptophanyl-tRNA synthetase